MRIREFILALSSILFMSALASSSTYISDTYVNTTMLNGSLGCGYLTGNTSNLCALSDTWSGNQSNYYTKTQGNTTYVLNSSWLNCLGVNNFTSSLGVCSTVSFAGYLTSETDPQWTGNQSNYYSLAFANATFMNFSSLLNCGKIFGNTSNLCTLVDTDTWAANSSAYYTIVQSNSTYVNFTGYNKTSWDTAFNYLSNGTILTSFTETDPKWTANFTTYNSTWSSITNQTYYTAFLYATNGTYYLATNPNGYTTTSDKIAVLTSDKWCVANSTGTGINCTADLPSGPVDTDTWATNFTSYYTIVQSNATYVNFTDYDPGKWNGINSSATVYSVAKAGEVDIATNTTMKDYVDSISNTTMATYVNSKATEANTSAASYCDGKSSAANTSATVYSDARLAGYTYTETDPKWLANYTACSNTQKLYFDVNRNLACANDIDTDGGANASSVAYSDARLATANSSVAAYALSVATTANTTLKAYTDANYIKNASTFSGTINTAGAVLFSGNFNYTGTQIYITKMCFNAACSAFANGTGIWYVGATTTGIYNNGTNMILQG